MRTRHRWATYPLTPTRRPRWVAVLVPLGVLAFVAVMGTILVTVAIWPGEAKLTAPLFCPDDKPDSYVVADHASSGAGETSTDYTMYCMGPRGETRDVGFMRQFLVLTLAHGLLLVLLIVGFAVLGLVRARRTSAG